MSHLTTPNITPNVTGKAQERTLNKGLQYPEEAEVNSSTWWGVGERKMFQEEDGIELGFEKEQDINNFYTV